MNYISPIYTELTECQDCYKCLRNCPAKAIRVENAHAIIVPELCVMCGRCVVHCPAHAKKIRDDVARAKQIIKQKKTFVSLAPSFVSEFSEFTPAQLCAALKKLGFYAISETAIGADLVSSQVADDLKAASSAKNEQKLFLSSACPSTVEYIKQLFPYYAKYITDRSSPLLAHARFLHKKYGSDIGIIFIGPCIAKKRESDVWNIIDIALTFNDLHDWLERERITPETIGEETANQSECFVPFRAAGGSLYPIDGGMITSVKKYTNTPDALFMTVTGLDSIPEALAGLKPELLKEPLFIELLACHGGCINGPGTKKGNSTAYKRVQLLDYAETAKDALPASIITNKPDMTGTLPVDAHIQPAYTEEQIQGALRSVGKYTTADELNCSCCGYDTCRDFAKAMLNSYAEKSMCISYMRKLAQKKANSLIKAIPSGVLIADRKMQVIECNYNFAKLMGRDVVEMYEAKPGLEGADITKLIEFHRFYTDVLAINGPDIIEREVHKGKKIYHVTVFAIEKGEVVGSVIHDITAPQVQKDRIVSQAHKVIDKNLSVVQKIAFLLGENAAETESMLDSIIESFSSGDEDDE
ncbi:MAG TPA: [Fe-Fe] hydrogenase large subunit C-terminal domain-containing protein [Treponemataceae bacterium]|nr:[Fe-Fe] hydrogenase large subunit C-terminal domain-containing protein [Treponemataceae bacterium]